MDDYKKPLTTAYYVRFAFATIAAVFGGLTLWSIVAPIDSAIVAAGQVVVESNRKAVQHLEGGVVGEILVREGDAVVEGDVVARLDDVTQKANLALIDAQLTELYARRARLEAERDGARRMLPARGAQDVLASPLFAEKAEGQATLFGARRTARLTQVSLLQERIVQQTQRISGLQAQIDSAHDQQTLVEDELAGIRELHERGFATKTRLRELEREVKRLIGEGGSLSASVSEAQSVIAEAKLEIERLGETVREEVIKELREVEVSIAELEERRIAAADSLRRTEIRAPQKGRILGLSIHTVGGVAAPGAPLMEIVPEGDRLLIAAQVSPQDIDRVKAGQTTLVRFSSLSARSTPEADGQVSHVSADSMVDQATGIPYYLVYVDLPEGQALSSILGGQKLVPGMPVETFIRTGSRPAIDYFLKPLTDSFKRSMREE
jgi:HlyD family secretion protein